MSLVVVLTISRVDAEDAPIVCVFTGMPLFNSMVDALHKVDKEIPKETITERMKAEGLSDKTLTQMSVLLVTARQSGEWPSIENRLNDGSLMAWQLLTVNDVMTLKDKMVLNMKRRRARRN